VAKELHYVNFGAIYTSSSRRAIESVTPLARARGIQLSIESSLREINFGDFEGRTYEEIELNEPQLYASWMKSPTTVTFPHGESFCDLRERTSSKVATIISDHQGETVLIATHGGVIRSVLSDFLTLDATVAFRLDQSYWGVSIVDIIDGTPLLRVMNTNVTSLRALFEEREHHLQYPSCATP
jgi:broad specificity phosphatase PhoE